MSHSELAQAELIQVQKLHLRLLYCAQTVRDFESDREAVLARWQVPARWGALLPDPSTPGHRAEMHGRWVLAIQHLLSVFQATITRIMGGRCEQVEILRSQWVRDYLSSDCFFDPQWSLPHPTGIGRAYEGHSRFFFWGRDYFSLRSQSAEVLLRDDLYLDFAACLDQRMVDAVDPAWEDLKHGYFWAVTPGDSSACRGLTAERKVFTVRRPEASSYLAQRGLVDLDRLNP